MVELERQIKGYVGSSELRHSFKRYSPSSSLQFGGGEREGLGDSLQGVVCGLLSLDAGSKRDSSLEERGFEGGGGPFGKSLFTSMATAPQWWINWLSSLSVDRFIPLMLGH